jgi:hypothetical protein
VEEEKAELMTTGLIIWDRRERRAICSGGAPLIFTGVSQFGDATASANEHIATALNDHRGTDGTKTYDLISVQVD